MECVAEIQGLPAGMLMHNNIQLTDPLDPQNRKLKAITGKQKKTDDDHRVMARMEFEMGLYFDPEVGPYVPAANIEKTLRVAGAITRQGTAVQRAVFVTEDRLPLLYRGPRSVEELWEEAWYDRRPVKVDSKTITRTRPLFREWSLEIPFLVDETFLNEDDFGAILRKAGHLIGLNDFRPRFGRFEVMSLN